jgi:electron transfer flavoprotein alpha subunit
VSNVLIIAEQHEGTLRQATLHAIAAGRELSARTGGKLEAALLGSGVGAAAQELAAHGVPVLEVDAPELAQPIASLHAAAVVRLVEQTQASYLGAASTAYGRDLLPRVAARLEAAMATDVLGFEGDGPSVSFRRPMWAGNVIAEVELATPVKVFTVRTTEFATVRRGGVPGAVRRADPPAAVNPRARHLGFQAVKSERPALTEARVVVSGGRGTKGDFAAVEALADALGAAVGASRAAVDAGWAPNDWQVGQTGKVVAPDLYVAAGISGAIQHLAGMKGARVVVAVNKDPDAPIFQIADYGLVGDLFQVLPSLAEKVKASR